MAHFDSTHVLYAMLNNSNQIEVHHESEETPNFTILKERQWRVYSAFKNEKRWVERATALYNIFNYLHLTMMLHITLIIL